MYRMTLFKIVCKHIIINKNIKSGNNKNYDDENIDLINLKRD